MEKLVDELIFQNGEGSGCASDLEEVSAGGPSMGGVHAGNARGISAGVCTHSTCAGSS